MLKGTFINQYRKTGGGLIARYGVTGSKAELAKYEEVQGEYLRKTEAGIPIFFVNLYGADGQRRLLDAQINIAYSENPTLGTKRFILDTSSEELTMAKQIKQLMPQSIANEMAKQWLTRPGQVNTTAPVQQPAAESVENLLDNMNADPGVEDLTGGVGKPEVVLES